MRQNRGCRKRNYDNEAYRTSNQWWYTKKLANCKEGLTTFPVKPQQIQINRFLQFEETKGHTNKEINNGDQKEI